MLLVVNQTARRPPVLLRSLWVVFVRSQKTAAGYRGSAWNASCVCAAAFLGLRSPE